MIVVSRRGFAFAALALIAPGVGMAAADYPARLAFAAIRNGKRIGEHRLSFETAGEALTVRTRAEMAVKIGPVTVYRYLHEAVERWRGDRFESLESATNSGGKRESVKAARTDGGVLIRAGGQPPATGPAGMLPFTHWNVAVARAPLFNPQTGKILRQATQVLGPGPVLQADGRSITARRITFTGDASIDNWYDAADVWVGLKGKLDDGSIMEYRRL